jgi:hypothetical protein
VGGPAASYFGQEGASSRTLAEVPAQPSSEKNSVAWYERAAIELWWVHIVSTVRIYGHFG